MDNILNSDYLNAEISKSIFQIQEEERSRIARDLHDATLQDLTYIVHKLELLGLYMEKDPTKANIELVNIKNSLKKTISDIRNIIFDLRPSIIDDLGLKESLNVFLQWLKENTNFLFNVDVDIIDAEPIILVNIYRIIVECVMNAVKYSEATEIIVKCKRNDNYIAILIQDNGKGFELSNITNKRINYGISIVKERVRILKGNVDIISSIGKGAKIDISIPF